MQPVMAQDHPNLPETDRIRLAEAFSLANSIEDQIWDGWAKVPFVVILITSDYEFLIHSSNPSADFIPLAYDSLLKSDVYYRQRTFPLDEEASFPIDGVPTVIIGQAEHTSSASSSQWVITMLHEHFHQLQNSQPSYFDNVAGLNLSGGDGTAMWMLNFPFPYSSPEVQQQVTQLGELLLAAIRAKDSELGASLDAYLLARQQLQKMLKPDEYKYLSFQLWQEGVARYTEYQVANFAAMNCQPSKAFQALTDYVPFQTISDRIR
jgi:hypothetical protein